MEDLNKAKHIFEANGASDCEIHNLNDFLPEQYKDVAEKSHLLVVRKGVNCILKSQTKCSKDLQAEQESLEPDKKYYDKRWKKYLNKQARYNLGFSDVK